MGSVAGLAKALLRAHFPPVVISWVFFDLGGTLLDDFGFHDAINRTYVEVLRARGYRVSLEEFVALRDLFIARQQPRIFRAIATEFTRDAAVSEEISREVAARVRGAEVTGQRAFPEASEVLETASRHASLGVVANQHQTVREVLKRDGLEGYFRVLLISEEAGVSKPDTALFERALWAAGCGASAAAMVGDRLDNDIEPAKALGLHTVRIRWGVFRNQEPTSANQRPDIEVATLREVPHALDRFARRD